MKIKKILFASIALCLASVAYGGGYDKQEQTEDAGMQQEDSNIQQQEEQQQQEEWSADELDSAQGVNESDIQEQEAVDEIEDEAQQQDYEQQQEPQQQQEFDSESLDAEDTMESGAEDSFSDPSSVEEESY